MSAAAIMSPERMEQAKQYRRIGYRMILVRLAVMAAYLAVVIGGLGEALWDVLPNTALWVLVLLAGQAVVELPAGYYQHTVARRFGISVQSAGSWLADEAKGFAINAVIYVLGAMLLVYGWRKAPGTWHLWMAAIAVAFNLAVTYVAPVLIAPLFHKYTPLGEGELRDRLLQLSQRAGVAVKGVFVSDVSRKETALNAFLSGIGSTRRIVLYDTLIAACSVDQIEVIMAHEMGHQVHNHIMKFTGAYSLYLVAVALIAGYGLEPLSAGLGLDGLTTAALPLVLLLFMLVGLALLPAMTAYSRHAERQADTFALQMTGKPQAFIEAFRKLADRNLADFDPPRWYYYLLVSHPPIPERVAMAERWAGGN